MAKKEASTQEGGAFNCGEHDFTTSDTEEWYKHCEDPANAHVEDVNGPCIFCGNAVQTFGLPWKRPDKPKGVVCDNCKVSVLGADPNQVAAANKSNSPTGDGE